MKKSGLIDSVRVQSPCSEDWDQMSGDDQVRFCSHCSRNVNDLSAMTRKDALKLVRRSKGNLCVRFVQHPVTQAPVFSDQFIRITQRASRLAAGVMSASITMSTLAVAQGGVVGMRGQNGDPQGSDAAAVDRPNAASSGGSISGTVTDPNGAVIPAATVNLLDSNGSVVRSLTSNDEGTFRFDRVPDGNYKVEVTATAFKKLIIDNVSVAGAHNALKDVAVELGLDAVQLMGVVAIGVEYEGAISAAVYGGDIETVSDLIARGENVNKREENRTTPLFVAVESGNLDMVRLLLAHGAKVNARNKTKQTPIMGLGDDASVELVDLLLAHGAKVDVVDENGYTPLIIAAAGADAKVVSALITAGSRIDAQNEEGMSALMMAAFRDDVEVVKILLAAGANVHLKNKDGETAWDQTSDEAIEDLLVAYGFAVPQEEQEQVEIRFPPPPHG